jgi:hypothetical protein
VFAAAGLVILIAVIAGVYYWGGASAEPTGETLAAREPGAARPHAEQPAPVRPTVIEREAGAPTHAPTAAPPVSVSTPPLAPTLAPSPSPAAVEPQALASVSSPPPATVPTLRPQPTLGERREAVIKAMRENDLAHVSVRVTDDRHVVLANLRDATEAEHARQLAVRATDGELPVDTALRPIVREPEKRRVPVRAAVEHSAEPPAAAPAWEIHREGSERTD